MNIDKNFQTPSVVANYMVSLMDDYCGTILEPIPGLGNLVEAVKDKGIVTAPRLFEDIPSGSRFDWVIMNPPFTPMKLGYKILFDVMGMTDNIVALLPWFTIINSEKRLKKITRYGLVSVTHLPRKTFPKARVQCCVLLLKKGYSNKTILNQFTW